MNARGLPGTGGAGELRRAFDASFAEAPAAERRATADYLVLNVSGRSCAVRLGAVAGVHAGRKITPLPTPDPGLVGLTGMGGTLVPVYDLGVLRGEVPDPGARCLLVAAAGTVGLAFRAIEGRMRVSDPAVPVGARRIEEAGRRSEEGPLEGGGGLLPVIDVEALVMEIEGRLRRGSPREEV